MLRVLRDDDNYDFELKQGRFSLPNILRGTTPLMMASFLGAIKCVRTLLDLSVDTTKTIWGKLTAVHLACAGGVFDVCRELDNLGLDFSVPSLGGSPAFYACEFGRDDILSWLWIRGAILGEPRVGWVNYYGGDPDVLCAAALHGHERVLRLLVEQIEIKFNKRLLPAAVSAIAYACEGGHDEVLDLLLQLGARVNEEALPAAIRSGSFNCVDRLVPLQVGKLRPKHVEIAAWSGFYDILQRVLRDASGFGDAWIIAWLRDWRDGQVLLERVNATAQWTTSGIALLQKYPGKAAEFTSVATLPVALLATDGWDICELQRVVRRLVRDGTATPAHIRALIERSNFYEMSPFWLLSTDEFAKLDTPADLTTIGDGVFWGCKTLTSFVFPSAVTSIRSTAFFSCAGLTEILIPESVTTIGESAFAKCSSLRVLEVTSRATRIEARAFENCRGLTRVTIPSDLVDLARYVFSGVRTIEVLTLVGSTLSQQVIEQLRDCLARDAQVIGEHLSGTAFGRFTIGPRPEGAGGRVPVDS
jgi:hypothetical protein